MIPTTKILPGESYVCKCCGYDSMLELYMLVELATPGVDGSELACLNCFAHMVMVEGPERDRLMLAIKARVELKLKNETTH